MYKATSNFVWAWRQIGVPLHPAVLSLGNKNSEFGNIAYEYDNFIRIQPYPNCSLKLIPVGISNPKQDQSSYMLLHEHSG